MSHSVSEHIKIRFWFFSFWLQLQKSGNKEKRKQKHKTKDKGKNELIRSMEEMDVNENEELDEQVEKVANREEAIPVAQDYEKIIRSKNEGILNVAFRQERTLKRFKDSEIFGEMIKELPVSRSTVYFKVNPLKLPEVPEAEEIIFNTAFFQKIFEDCKGSVQRKWKGV